MDRSSIWAVDFSESLGLGDRTVNTDIDEKFFITVHTLVNKPCWGIAAGANTGSVIDLHFGQKLPLRQPVLNPTLSADLRRYYGELSLFIECAWRLDAEDQVLCGWGEDFSAGGPLGKGLQLVINQRVEKVSIQRPAFDLAVHFSNALVLWIFCDQTESSEDNNNYALFTPEHYYVVSNKSRLVWKERSELEKP
jgi:hypothetical protein